jgi:ABC-2 type transport system permease protein
MRQALKSEFRKLFSVRSTYVMSGIALLIVIIGSFYGSGYKAEVYDQTFLASVAVNSATAISFFTALIAVLIMAHEYRYNTIVYALTLINSRSKVLAAKFITVLGFTVIFSAIVVGLSLVLAMLGANMAGHHLPHQDFNALIGIGKSVFYCTGFALAGLLFTALIRNITASVAVLFIVPNTLEALLSILLKHNAKYLPFHSLQDVVTLSFGKPNPDILSPGKGALIFSAYLIFGWLIAWYLFLRRDAN